MRNVVWHARHSFACFLAFFNVVARKKTLLGILKPDCFDHKLVEILPLLAC